MIFITKSADETENVGRLLAEKLDTANVVSAFIALRGEMGVGKTAFTRGFASYYEISGVRSPTYTVVNEYSGKRSIYHFDMYRIESEDDLYSIGFDDYIEKPGYKIAEWSENVEDFLPGDSIFVTISRDSTDVNMRKIEIDMGKAYDNLGI
jgi:tRNA threonylcarbamoyladenosine biosynthesis protein TsaE